MAAPHERGARRSNTKQAGPRIVTFPASPSQHRHCFGCGVRFDPYAPHHRLCPICFRYSELFTAILRLRELSR